MNFKRAALAAMLALPLAASAACSVVNVEVGPFTVTHDYTKTNKQIEQIANDVGTVGLLRVTIEYAVTGCDVKVRYPETTLYVSKQLQRNRCAFDHVLTHELEHVAIHERHIATLAARIKARGGEADLFAAVEEEINSAAADNAAHDSPEEYATLNTACHGRILGLLR